MPRLCEFNSGICLTTEEKHGKTSVRVVEKPRSNTQVAKELKITPILDKLQEYKRNWIHHVNRMPRNRLPRVMKQYFPTSRRNRGRPLKRILDA